MNTQKHNTTQQKQTHNADNTKTTPETTHTTINTNEHTTT